MERFCMYVCVYFCVVVGVLVFPAQSDFKPVSTIMLNQRNTERR